MDINILTFTDTGFKLDKNYLNYCFLELKKSKKLRDGYSLENFIDIAKTNYDVVYNLLSFLDYIQNGLTEYIKDDLNDIVNVFNEHKGTSDVDDIFYSYNDGDILYVERFLDSNYENYSKYISKQHIEQVLRENYKLLNEVKHKNLLKNNYYKSFLIGNLQVILVGMQEPAPCARQSTKDQYYSLYNNLKKIK